MPTKTLEATLAPPTAHKERKLQEIHDLYHEGLHEAFDAGADTQSAVNDIVTPYDLPYQVKDALKNYVPSLDDARELSDDHPTRMVNRAARFDCSEDRTHSYVWEVPQPGHGPNFWIPLRINPEQEQLWADLLAETYRPVNSN